MKADDLKDTKLADLHTNSVDVKAITSQCQHIKLIRAVGTKLGFNLFDNTPGEFHELDDQTYNLVQRVFRIRRANPNNQEESGNLYATLVNKIGVPLLTSYTKAGLNWDIGFVEKQLALNRHKNNNCTGFAPAVVDKFGLVVAESGLVECLFSDLDR